MARMRYLKPELWTDSKVVRMSPWARLLFIGSWNFALCEAGHLDDDATALKLKVLPADPIDADEVLEEVISTGRIVRRSLPDGRSYLHIVNLGKHQKVDTRWATRCPYCSADGGRLPETQESSGESHRASPQDGMGGDRRGETNTPGRDATAHANANDDDVLIPATAVKAPTFDDFYAVYPRHEGRARAKESWTRSVRKVDPALIVEGAKRFAADPNLPEKRLIPHPKTWLDGRRWEDDALPPLLDRKREQSHPVRADGTVDADVVLGKDNWQPDSPPSHIEPGTRAYVQWLKDAWAVHNAERAEKAREVLARRSA